MNRRRTTVAAAIALLATTGASAVAVAGPASAAPAAPPGTAAPDPDDRLIVRYEAGVDERESGVVLQRHGVQRSSALPLLDMDVVEVPAGMSTTEAARALTADPAVAYAEPDAWITAASADPGWSQQWGLDNAGQVINGQVGSADIDVNAPEAWALAASAPASPVVVAVLDGGIDMGHPDLAPNAYRNPGEVPGNGRDDDGNGLVDDDLGWDFAADDRTVLDAGDDGHGTHVAGIVAASTDNGIGVAGTAGPGGNVRILPVRVLGPAGGLLSDAIAGVHYAKVMGARVINASWGGPQRSIALRDEIAGSGALFVTASGNEGQNNDAVPSYPAAERLPNVLTVTAVNSSGGRSTFANHGRSSVHLGAPGENVLSTVPGGGYAYFHGTSMATPFVSGAAGLLAARQPGAAATDLAAVLRATARPLPSLTDGTITGGMLDVAAALRAPRSARLACPDAVLQPPLSGRFPDVGLGSTHQVAIDCAAWWGWVAGRGDGTFDAGTAITRGQAASLLARLVGDVRSLPPATTDHYDDDDGTTHEQNINALAELGLVNGTGPGAYRPAAHVTREQLATLLVRVHEFLTGTGLPATGTPFFDVAGSAHRAGIEKAYLAGLTGGTSATTFAPTGPVTRAQTASFLVRAGSSLVEARTLSMSGR